MPSRVDEMTDFQGIYDAVVNDRFYILTHDGSTAGVSRRLQTIVDGENDCPR